MSKSNPYMQHHLDLLKELNQKADALLAMEPFQEDRLIAINTQLQDLSKMATDERFFESGQDLIVKIVAAWPQLTPHVARDLFWFFGGDCLQYMPDDEIAKYQALDEARHQAEADKVAFSFADSKTKIFGLH